MMDDANSDQRVLLADAELALFAQKLNAWAESSLSVRERTFLEQMLADAADASNQDASGYINLSSLTDDDLGGYAQSTAAGGAVVGAIIGYAQGLAGDDSEIFGDSFDPDGDAL